MSRLFASGGQSIGTSASASVLPVNIQGWVSLGLTGLIFLLSKGLLRVFSTRIPKHQFFGIQPSLLSNSRICTWLTTGKKHSFDYCGPLLAKWCLCFLICCLGLPLLFPKEQASFNFMTAVTIQCDFGAWGNKVCHCFHCFSIYLPLNDGTRCHDLYFRILSFKPDFSLSSFTFIKSLFNSSLLSVVRVVSSAYLRLLIFLPKILIPACTSSSPAFHMMHSAY